MAAITILDTVPSAVPTPDSGKTSLFIDSNVMKVKTSTGSVITVGGGSVSSVDVSGGTTGLTFTGGPITSSGTITMGGALAVANGGVPTGGTTGQVLQKTGSADYALGWVTPSPGGVTSFNTRTGAITLTSIDVTDALGYTPGSGSGTVSSVDASGGTTGLTFSGGPITTSGTLTLGGALAVANGGVPTGGASGYSLVKTGGGDYTLAWEARARTGANGDITSLVGVTGLISTPTGIDFNTSSPAADAVGRLNWNTTDGTLNLGLVGGNVSLQLGQEQVVRVLNNTGSTITNGQIVYITGASGNRPTIALAKADSEATSSSTLGMATEDIANNQMGFITITGIVHNIDTSAFTDGAMIYLSPTVAGGYTATEPTAPNHRVVLGYVIRAHATVGQVFITVDTGLEIGELHDVKITSPTNGQVLTYNSAAGYWDNADLPAGGTVTSVAASGSQGVTISGSPITTSGTISIGLGAITPTSVAASGTITGSNLSGTNTGDQTYIAPQVQTASVATSTTINWASKDVTRLTLTGNTAITNSGAVDGQKMILQLVQGGSGSYTVTFTSETQFGTSFTSITLSTAVGKMDMVGLVYSSSNSKYNIVSYAAGY